MKKFILLFPLLSILHSHAQNCDSLIVIYATYHDDDGNFSTGLYEIDSLQNGLVVSSRVDTTTTKYYYDSLRRITGMWTTTDSTVYSYDSNSRIISTNYYHKNGIVWQYNSDMSNVSYFYSVHGLDSIVEFKWDGTQMNSFYRQYLFYNPNDTLFKIQSEMFDSSIWVIDTLTFVYYPVNIPGISRIDSSFNGSVVSCLVTNYDSLNRMVVRDSYMSFNYPFELDNFTYDCNQLLEFSWTIDYDGGHIIYSFDSLCRIINKTRFSYGQLWDGSTSYDYYYLGCSSQVVRASMDVEICKGDSVAISATHFGGKPPFMIRWAPSHGLISDTLLNTKASPDTTTNYIITVTDSNNLSTTDTVLIKVFNPPLANIHISSIDTTSICQSAILATDSMQGYGFGWSKDNLFLYNNYSSHLPIFFNAQYVVYVWSNNVCPEVSDTLLFNYFTSTPPIVTLSRSCHEIYAAHSVPSHIQWFFNNQLIVDSLRDTLVMAQDGIYSAIITDSSGCSSPTAPQIEYYHLTVSSTIHNTCMSSCNGYIEGSPYYDKFLWSNGDSTYNIQNLCSGIYSAIVTDQFGCTASLTDTIKTFPSGNFHYITTGTSGPLACDAIVIPVDSTNTPYNAYYAWDNSTYGYMNDSMCSGWHTITVTPHSSYCQQIDSFFIPSHLSTDTCSILESHTNMSCNGYVDGTITIRSSTGSPFACLWSSPNVNANYVYQQHLNAGTYSCTMIDKNGCMDSTQITITEPPPLSVSFNLFQSFCGDSCAVSVIGSGGTPPYRVHWCDGSNSNPYINCIEQCNVLLIDSNNCYLVDTVIQPAVSPIIFHTINIPPSCHLCNDGSMIIIASGGVPPYLYSVDNGSQGLNDTITNLSDTNHIVCVTGNNGCSNCESQILLNSSSVVFKKHFSISPNPFHDRTIFNFSDFNPKIQTRLVIYDVIGKMVKEYPVSDKQFELQRENLPPGIYTIVLKARDFISERDRIVIE